ncbi:calcium/sodium antiporter [Roseobacter sp. HKCCD9010]|uniref:calcium/sodium antiporter n=1 Tax=unclassified Roseobacter TaxID=196798 RepID=UPI001490D15B|nr:MULTISPECIES: calcium/sodium antiporter [unclassified Roseobacter]MBF9048687.1 calcium/sodium antiporter [Rhodobacterales bacterium HKCCD4356]NNV10686.1 calcium/sodium antiporter [Roseobacter sp. HKCCD7357]NNV14871.1 calcium/sodium antiporter [Roseobacter sp. HKCCD8768]NNV24330.1 calcium/sodium antiporter [Roseobacter sp. HKCCD8192]NNV28587.1 calcium/sodium antiporter [Roseobacter sp. HKCCD9061]
MIIEFLLAGLGLIILLLAGDVLVRGAVNLSLRLGIPALIVSLTVVAFGTSAPELLISIQAIWEGVPGLALGNVVGSNTANVLLVLGVPALISGLDTRQCETRRTYLMMIAGTFLFIGLAYAGPFIWWHGLVLLAGLSLVLGDAFRSAQAHRAEANGAMIAEEELEEADPSMPWWKIGLYMLLGLIGLPLGADLLVDSATSIARAYGISETVIGLTLVAIGTSLPELATTVMAAIRQHAEVAIGNVIGSNMFNLLAIIGVASLVGPIPVAPEFFVFDFWVMLAASLVLAPFVFMKLKMGRVVGLAFVALYIIYIGTLLA